MPKRLRKNAGIRKRKGGQAHPSADGKTSLHFQLDELSEQAASARRQVKRMQDRYTGLHETAESVEHGLESLHEKIEITEAHVHDAERQFHGAVGKSKPFIIVGVVVGRWHRH